MKLCALLCLTALLASAAAHICSLSPVQRGGVNVSLPGDESCWRRSAPCGGIAPGPVQTTYYAGEVYDVLVQQNLNHYYAKNPGYLDVGIALTANPQSDDDFTVLAQMQDWAAFEQVWQTNFTIEVQLPYTTASHAVLRVRYVSQNPDEVYPSNNTDAIFWNCADIALVSRAAVAKPGRHVQKPKSPAAIAVTAAKKAARAASPPSPSPPPCLTPAAWSGSSIDTLGVARSYAVDNVGQRVFIDRTGSVSTQASVTRLATWTFYKTAGIDEWVLWEYADADPVCELYGGDAFYQWGYGMSVGQYFTKTATVYGEAVNLWTDGAFDFASTVDGCLPVLRVQNQAVPVVESFGGVAPNITDPDAVFTVPSICQSAVRKAFCRGAAGTMDSE